jgi:hypothetical protein
MSGERVIVTHLQRQFEAAQHGSRWHSFRAALKGIQPDEATWQPPHYKGFPWAKGSIVELVFHVAGGHALPARLCVWGAHAFVGSPH